MLSKITSRTNPDIIALDNRSFDQVWYAEEGSGVIEGV